MDYLCAMSVKMVNWTIKLSDQRHKKRDCDYRNSDQPVSAKSESLLDAK